MLPNTDILSIAFYGSLLRGLGGMGAVGIGSALRFIGPCTIQGRLYDLGPYPGLRDEAGEVAGELYAILEPMALVTLDEFEGFNINDPQGSLYLRRSVELTNPARMAAWTYFYNHAPARAGRVQDGDWRAHLARRDRN